MGYRSDVHAVFYTNEDDWPVLKLFFDENFPMEQLGAGVRELKSEQLRGYYFLETHTKWYESYPEVQAFDTFVGKLLSYINADENAQPWRYEFVRIGEDDDDMEIVREGDCDWLLNPERTVRTDFKEIDNEDARA